MSENTIQNPQNGTATAVEAPGACYTPRVDLVELEDAFLLYADMPGVKPEDLDVRFEKGELTLHGRCAAGQRNVLAAEYGVGDYYRAFTLGQHLDPDKITAELKQGVLTLRVPKAEVVRPRKIPVQAGV